MLVQRRRDSRAALRLMRKLLKKQGFAPKLLVTDKLRSYASAFRRLGLSCRHQKGLRMNSKACRVRPSIWRLPRDCAPEARADGDVDADRTATKFLRHCGAVFWLRLLRVRSARR
jgi:hypothetical protein